jgi:hypothetical protein
MRGVEVNAVIAPSSPPRELVHRHQLNVGNAEIDQVIETFDGRLEGSPWSEGPDMQFVHNRCGEGSRLPALVLPGKCLVIDHPGGTVDSIRLPGGTRVWQGLAVVEDESIITAWPGDGDIGRPPAALTNCEREALATNLYVDLLGHRGPHAKRRHNLPLHALTVLAQMTTNSRNRVRAFSSGRCTLEQVLYQKGGSCRKRGSAADVTETALQD